MAWLINVYDLLRSSNGIKLNKIIHLFRQTEFAEKKLIKYKDRQIESLDHT
jgi:hypothetical protein